MQFAISERQTPKIWFLCLAAALGGLGLLKTSILYLIWEGTGIWGLNNPTYWGWAIVNFVFWVGIGHAGTLISAILSSRARLADWCEQLRRSYDSDGSSLCWGIPRYSHWSGLGSLLAFPIPNQMTLMAELSLTSFMGRIRCIYLCYCITYSSGMLV